MFKFSRRQEFSTELVATEVRPELEELENGLVEVKLSDVRAMDTLDMCLQTPEELATAVPGDALSIKTDDAQVEGRIYTLGDSAVFIAQRLIGDTHPDCSEDIIEKQALDVKRTIAADKMGHWYEHVYPLSKGVVDALNDELHPLVEYANETDSFFVVAVVDSSYVVMPATMNKKTWENGPSQRYAQYANLKDGYGELATQAMIYIDPGEESGYINSEQIGVMDKDIPAGQLQYDVDEEGIVSDRVSDDYLRGRKFKLFRAMGSFGIGGSDHGCDITVDGPHEERIFLTDASEHDLKWEVSER